MAAIVSREEGQFGRRRLEGKTGRGVYVCEVSQKGWILGVGDHAGALIARRLFPPLRGFRRRMQGCIREI